MADKAYSSKRNRAYLRGRGIKAVIRSRETRNPPPQPRLGRRPITILQPRPLQAAQLDHSTVERCLNKLKQFRAVATRYEKRERIYQGTIDVASIRIWLRDPVT